MSTDLTQYAFEGREVRVLVGEDGEPRFVAADALAILDLDRTALRRLDDDEKGVDSIHTPGGMQQVTVVTEAGLYSLILSSRKPEAKPFRRWVTHDVLPSIRHTGSYATAPALAGADLLAAAVIEAQAMLAARDERIAELEPRAAVADHIMDAEGDMSVGDAAKALARSGAAIGQQRLFALLDSLRWTYRQGGVRHVSQRAIETGYLSARPQSHYHPRTGALVLDPPQVRVTPKGLARLLTHLLPASDEPTPVRDLALPA